MEPVFNIWHSDILFFITLAWIYYVDKPIWHTYVIYVGSNDLPFFQAQNTSSMNFSIKLYIHNVLLIFFVTNIKVFTKKNHKFGN